MTSEVRLDSGLGSSYNSSVMRSQDHLVGLDISYILHCSQVNGLQIFYITLFIVWVLVCAGTCVWTYYCRQDQTMYLQRLMIIFPLFKTVHTLIVSINIGLCQDQETWETANKYLVMGLISFETLLQTILLTVILVISKGWGIVRFYVLREEATHVTVALGSVYLCYSAFFVTIEIQLLNLFVKYSIVIVYVTLAYYVIQNMIKNVKILNVNIRYAQQQQIPLLDQALVLKKQILTQFFVFACIYMFYQLSNITIVSNMQYMKEDLGFMQGNIAIDELIDLVCLTAFQFIFRSRNWPAFFQLNVYPIQLGQNFFLDEESEAQQVAPMMELIIRRKDLKSNRSLGSFDSKASYSGKPFVLLNPIDDSRINNSNIEEEKLKDILGGRLLIAYKDDNNQQVQQQQQQI